MSEPSFVESRADSVRIDEPYGHDHYLSKFERAWAAGKSGQTLARTRTQRFDLNNSLLYSPMAYEYGRLVVSIQAPSATWIREEFIKFVRDEFRSDTTKPVPDAVLPVCDEASSCGFDVLADYLDICESDLLYAGAVRSIQEASNGDMVEDVLRVLIHPLIGHKANARNLDPITLRSVLEEQVDRKGRLLFVVPACPFKDENPLRTLDGAAYPDAGEVAFLITLHTLALALYQVHPFGADCVILSDGELYSDVFGVPNDDAVRYRDRLRTFRNRLNMQGTVSILDLQSVIASFARGAGEEAVEDAVVRIRTELQSFAGSTERVGDSFRTLGRAMRWNLSTRQLLENHDAQAIWTILSASDDATLDPTSRQNWREIEERAVRAAVEYGTTNLMMRYLDIVARMFPGSIRATVHPKVGQLAIRALGSAYPWNGVAFRTSEEMNPLTFEARPLYELAGRSPLRRVFLEGYSEKTPLYLEKA